MQFDSEFLMLMLLVLKEKLLPRLYEGPRGRGALLGIISSSSQFPISPTKSIQFKPDMVDDSFFFSSVNE